jgi:tetratricopeptide (TPR) repeat protein
MFFGVSFVLGLIDAVVFFSMDEQELNRRYNSPKEAGVPPRYRPGQKGYPPPVNRPRNYGKSMPRNMQLPQRDLQNQFKTEGIKKYKDFDLEGAIEDFKRGLEIQPQDISLHFNLACAYSLTEQVDKAYTHLDRAVALGFDDFEKIKSHDDLAYVRIQDRFESFKTNGFRLDMPVVEETEIKPGIRQIEEKGDDVLLTQLKRLAELRDRGLLSEKEFLIEKKKLTR